jgi:hypothetical protein
MSFVWDWLHMANTHHGAGCITINGTFLCWERAIKASHDVSQMANTMGPPVAQTPQNSSWFKTMGPLEEIPVDSKSKDA